MIRGSAVGSMPHMVICIMQKHGKPMTSASIFAQFAPELKVRRISVGTALNELCKKNVVVKTGIKKPLLFSLTGIKHPVRLPVKPYWKPKPTIERETKFDFKNKTTPKIQTKETIANAAELDAVKLETLKKSRMQAAPELITCDNCEIYGPERNCPDCKYVSPHERAAA